MEEPLGNGRDLLELVTRLEAARTAGGLGPLLDGSATDGIAPILTSYKRLAGWAAEPTPYRSDHVRALALEATWPLRNPGVVFPAALRKRLRRAPPDPPAEECWLVTGVTAGNVTLRADQACAARYWGIGFRFDEPDDEALFEARLHRQCAVRLAQMLRDLDIVEHEYHWKRSPHRVLLPPRSAADFEHLIIDILNEREYVARHAPLAEDILEQTDVRVQMRKLNRRRGARVQVTATVDPLFYQSKVASLRHIDELVVLSPATIAQHMHKTGDDIGPASALAAARAGKVRESLEEALRRRHAHPLGPVAAVPAEIREAVREYVEAEAVRSTCEMRLRAAQNGPRRGKQRGRR
jgi:hypothetical protein